MSAGGVILTPCSNTTWGCGFECGANTFPVSIGSLQISEANYAELDINNETAPLASSASTPTLTPAAASMSVLATPTHTAASGCAITSPPKPTASIVGIGVGVPLGLAFAITALLFLNERRKLLIVRKAFVLSHNSKSPPMVYQVPEPAKLQYSQSNRSQPPHQQSHQPPCPGPFSADTFLEAGDSPGLGLGEKQVEKETLQELP
ncbi:hypothetical protein MMC15_002642 [Xylographa vitiligo]|nr:hypothetical protein [Xylographa vitiligo]